MNYGFTLLSRAGQNHPKLDPRLASLVELSDETFGEIQPPASRSGYEANRDVPLRRSAGPLAFLKGPLAGKKARSGSGSHNEALRGYDGPAACVPIFITVKPNTQFESLGVKLRSTSGTIATAFLTIEEILRLESQEAVVAVEWTGGAKPTSQPDSQPTSASPRKTLGMVNWDSTLDGRGTLIGVVDAGGIDIYHPDLVNPGNISKVRWIWDQTVEERSAKPPPEWGYGQEYTFNDLFVELNPNRHKRYAAVNHQALKQSHATAVAGIAAGFGVENEDARGVAPGAELIYLGTHGSGERALATMIELAEAVDYVFNRADKEGKPCVINVSLGDDLGPRDGTSPVERFFDSVLEKPGRAIVVAAGNSAGKKKHVSGTLGGTDESGAGRDRTDRLGVYIGRRSFPHLVIEIWCNAGATPSIEVVAPTVLGKRLCLHRATGPTRFSSPIGARIRHLMLVRKVRVEPMC
ncbi:MAG: S8 family serine peptidase [Polyangiaceae bacterium]|nr:S8 family serine peptidase [Polyangiaceae bacterium]